MRFSLKNKMALTVCFLLLFSLSATAVIFLHIFSDEIKNIISQHQLSLITEMAEDIDEQIRLGQKTIIRIAATVPPEIVTDSNQVQLFLDQRLGEGTKLFFDNGIFFFSRTGILLAEYPFHPNRRGKDYSFRDYFSRTVASRQPQVSDPYFSSQEHHHPAISFTAPIFDKSGQIIAVIAGSVDLTKDNFLGGIGKIKFGQTGYLYLFNRDRLMIMHPDQKRILQKDVPLGANHLFDRSIDGFEGTGETINSRGIPMLTSFKHLSETNWILAANYPTSEAFTPIAKTERYIIIGFLTLLVFLTLTVWLVMGRFIRPLLTLTSYVQEMTTADTPRRPLQITTHDEIALLVSSFNRLMSEVEEQKILSLERLNFLQILSNSIPNPIYYKDLDGRYLGCNLAYEQIRGVTRAEILGKTTSETFDNVEAKEQELDEFELLHDSDSPCDIAETALNYSDGTRHDVLFYRAILRDDQGIPTGLVGTMIDITDRKAIETALAEEQQFSENLLQNSAVPCFVLNKNHEVITWNLACEELTGLTSFEVIGTDHHWRAFYPEQRPCLADLILTNDLEMTLDLYPIFASSQLIPEGLQAEGWYDNVGGKRRYLFFEAAPIRDRNGHVIAAIETLQDHSSLKHAEQALRQSEESYRSLIEHSPDAIIVHRNGDILFVNQAAATLFGAAKPNQMAGRKVMDLFPPDYRQIALERISQVEISHDGVPYLDEKVLRLDGEVVDVEVSSTPVFYHEKFAVQSILRDIKERKELQERIWRQANFDSLTQIPNRMLFIDRLRQAIERADRDSYAVALLFIDLDHFKEINDTLGHESGDELLKQVAVRLQQGLRKSDTLARMGGDEFTVIMPCVVEPPHVSVVVSRLLILLSQPFALPGGEGKISGSIGIALFPGDAKDISLLLHHADIAMYRAKQRGRNTFCFYSSTESENQNIDVRDS